MLTLRLMTLDDIPQVVQIDQQAFSTPWSARTYAYEVGESQNSHMLAVELQPDTLSANGHHRNGASIPTSSEQTIQQRRLRQQETAERRDETPVVSNPRAWLQRLRTPMPPPPPPPIHQIVSYGGLWRMIDEAHISTIASHPNYRGQGFGEIALVAMMRRSAKMGAGFIVLEVRVNNHVAQNLYRKHGFKHYSTKPRYYRDNNEDAYDMRVEFNAATCREIDKRFEVLRQRYHFVDSYTEPSQSSIQK
jgi:ribosomal-protein-alanine N-acetyltransferase